MRQADADDGRAERLTSAEKKEIAELRRRNRQLELENDILKRAAAYFARDNVLPTSGVTKPRVFPVLDEARRIVRSAVPYRGTTLFAISCCGCRALHEKKDACAVPKLVHSRPAASRSLGCSTDIR